MGSLSPSYAQTTSVLQPTESYLKDQYEFLKNQSIRFEDRVQKEREQFYSFVSTLLAIVTAIAGGSLLGSFWAIRNKSKKVLEDYIEKNKDTLKKNAERYARDVIDSELGLNKNILVIADKDQHQALVKNELDLLKNRGFNNVDLKTPNRFSFGYDLIIFCYSPDLDKDLSKLIEKLEKEKRSIPVLAYYSEGKVNNNKFMKYKLRAFANSPLTVVSWAFTILSSYRPS